jgi:DNA-binding SARP family transcriptional activator/TolB-like protein/tetratricopeptide (TPR) repeat protein
MAVRIYALGTLRVEQNGRVLDRLPAQRVRCALLVYLALERETTRDRVMGLFWADRPPERARRLLSQTLYELRQDLGSDWMSASGDHLCATDALEMDAVDFAEAVEAGQFDRAVDLYEGAFLGGASLAADRELEGWLDRQQARLARLHRQARRGAIDSRVETGRLPEALGLARSWAELDPLDDEAQHRLIELMAATGDRSGALRQYERYAHLVATELELEPLDETRELVDRIRDGDVGERPAPAAELNDGAPGGAESGRPGDLPAESYGAAYLVPDAYGADAPEDDEVVERDDPGGGGLAADAGSGVGGDRGVATVRARVTRSAPTGARSVPARPRRRWTVAVPVILAVAATAAAALVWTGLSDRGGEDGLTAPTEDGPGGEHDAFDLRRIAVLFFQDNSADQSLGHLAAGFTDALIHELDQVEGLEILSRAAIERFRDGAPPLDDIVNELQVGTVVVGSLTPVGDSLRVTFSLVDASSKVNQLSGTLSRPVDSLLTIVRDLPVRVALRLRERLGEEVRLRDSRDAAGASDAWVLVQRARVLAENERVVMDEDFKTAESLLVRADSMLSEAERIDPAWLEPTVERARVGGLMAKLRAIRPGKSDPALARAAIHHADRALASSPQHVPALEQRGILYFDLAESVGEGEDPGPLYQQAESDLRAATELEPRNARAWWALSRVLRRKDSLAEAKQAARRALAADAFLQIPVGALLQLFETAFSLEEHAEARDWCRTLHERYPDRLEWVQCELMLLASSPAVTPDPERARALVDSLVVRGPEPDSLLYRKWALLFVAKTLQRAGQSDSARALMERTTPGSPPNWAVYDVAHLHLMLGNRDQALQLLERRVRQDPGRAASLAADWWFRDLHGDPEFERIVGITTEAGG